MYDNYVFDIYGTLVDIRTDEQKMDVWDRLSVLLDFYGVSYSSLELRAEYFECCSLQIEKGKKKFDYPEVDVVAVFKTIAKKKGVVLSTVAARVIAQSMRAFSTEYIRLYDNVKSTLAILKSMGKRLYILSNAQHCFTYYEIKKLGLLDFFDGVIFSSDYGIAKPSVAFFNVVLNKYQLDKERTIYIGNDALSDVNGARRAGISCIWLKTNHTDKDIFPDMQPEYVCDGNFEDILKITD